MTCKSVILSALLVACGAFAANASDFTGDECIVESLAQINQRIDKLEGPTYQPVDFDYSVYKPAPIVVPAQSLKTITVKPVAPDKRPPVWDGVHGKYESPGFSKTVDGRDGVPIWDDSISNYRDKDFSDWFLEPMEEVEVDWHGPDEAVRYQVEELLTPLRPKCNLWTYGCAAAPQIPNFVEVREVSDGCPFETANECAIWRKKPMVRETVAPRSPQIRGENMDMFIEAACQNTNINANEEVAAPLLSRYHELMNASRACCTEGMIHQLRRAGASNNLVYKFLVDDANFYHIGDRCLFITDSEFDKRFPNTATATVAADVRNGCLCRNQQWFTSLLAPFHEVYKAAPEFAGSRFYYTYIDGLQREVTVSINADVQNVLQRLALCP